jgi:CelD/BcsL family acetyltransferase involved in cellulose biosynthesis
MEWKIKIVTSWDEICGAPFQEQWLKMSENAVNSHAFFHPALCMAWIETYRPLRDLEPLFCIADKGSPDFFLPLLLWRKNWKNLFQKVIIPAGYSDFDYHEPLLSAWPGNPDLSNVFSGIFDEISGRYRFDAAEIGGILSRTEGKYWSVENESAPFSDLSSFRTPGDFMQTLKTSLRGDIGRQIRRLEKIGSPELLEYNDLNDAVNELPAFLELHKRKWPGAYKARGFHENLLRAGFRDNLVHFTALRVNENIISYHLGFRYKRRYYYYMPVIDPGYENYSPGKLHLMKLVEYAINNNFLIFDHLRGSESYKSGWTSDLQPLYRYSRQSERLLSRCRNKLLYIKGILA